MLERLVRARVSTALCLDHFQSEEPYAALNRVDRVVEIEEQERQADA
jgi:hypothetical protein